MSLRAGWIVALAVCGLVGASCSPDPGPVDRPIAGHQVVITESVVLIADGVGLDVERVVEDAIETVAAHLEGDGPIELRVGTDGLIPGLGIGGFTAPDDGAVSIDVDARGSEEQLERAFRTWLPTLLAHELHHSQRIREGPGYGLRLIEALVTEGSADAFALEVTDGPPLPWTDALTDEQEAAMWERAQDELTAGTYDHRRWFFGGEGIPPWTGYTLGYRIVRAYLDGHPSVRAADLVTLRAPDILRESGYDPA